ncbi:alpha/beta hydrolase [uncultured Nocardioides sp.]|uniref:alpha/beta hydrolase n=1 Tax=uncultured Nocardioides sp. TaxID=198441 RepID=UPI002606739A|nr:alpha/beta hydrolase [uncultured Nocardioides sp.]
MPTTPSLRHQLLAEVVPRLRKAAEVTDEPTERARVLARKATKRPGLPTVAVPGFARRFSVVEEEVEGATTTFPAYSFSPRGLEPVRTILYLHGGGYVHGIDPFQVRYAARLAAELGARVVMPAYPTTPEHTWRESHEALVALAQRLLTGRVPVALVGDSAGGGLALALAQSLRDRTPESGSASPDRLVLFSPWVDLTLSAPDTEAVAATDPWLFPGKARVWARWWAGSDAELFRSEVSPGLGDLDGLPRTLMVCGGRDMLAPGCRALADRAVHADWDLTYVERPDLIHVFGLLPGLPEAGQAMRAVVRFLTVRR